MLTKSPNCKAELFLVQQAVNIRHDNGDMLRVISCYHASILAWSEKRLQEMGLVSHRATKYKYKEWRGVDRVKVTERVEC
jgi:hypothetical protein